MAKEDRVMALDKKKKDGMFREKKRKRLNSGVKNKKLEAGKKRHNRGPRLPNILKKEVNFLSGGGEEEHLTASEEIDDALANDFYEYEEATAEEESRKNKRYDPVENCEFELPDNFEDWKVESDESGDEEINNDDDHPKEHEDDAELTKMFDKVTGGRKRKEFIVSESYQESEFNPTSDVLDGDGKISIKDLEDLIHGTPGFSKLRKSLHQTEKKSVPTLTPLPKTEKERFERIASYEQSKKDITKWEPVVKRNREASTLYFDEDVDTSFCSIGAIASGFEPRTDFEKNIASLVRKKELVDAHMKDGATLLEMNKLSLEDVKDRHERLAKMRSFLFRHELKAKRVKKIKSKTYHRLLKKDRKKAAEAGLLMDPEAAKKQAREQEFKRAQERMSLKHKNHSKWAKRILQRGLNVQDEATREAFGEQLNQHAALTRKINSVKESSSDESSDDDSGTMSDTSDQANQSNLMNKAKEKTLKLLEEDEEIPKSGVLSLPFMIRGLQKKKEAADQEAKLALAEFESSTQKLEGKTVPGNSENHSSSGRKVFGAPKQAVKETRDNAKVDNYYGDSDSEDDEPQEENLLRQNQNEKAARDLEIDPNILREEFENNLTSVLEQTFEGSKEPVPKETYEVAYLASDSWKKVKRSSGSGKQPADSKRALDSVVSSSQEKEDLNTQLQEHEDNSDTDDADEMVDGIVSLASKRTTYELPSQAELIQRAFAGDDVIEEFKKDKEAVLDEENPEPEKPVLLPGWGQWTDIQKKKGLPSWMIQEHEMAQKKRLESLKKRKDAHLSNVIISERLDKKAEKLVTKTLPFPFTSQEVFDQSVRMPIGPEFNPATAVGPLIRPEIVKKPGVMIKPISYEDVRDNEKPEPQKHKHNNQKQSKAKKQRKGKR